VHPEERIEQVASPDDDEPEDEDSDAQGQQGRDAGDEVVTQFFQRTLCLPAADVADTTESWESRRSS